MTDMATQYRARRKLDYRDVFEFLDLVSSIDPDAQMERVVIESGKSTVRINFSDGTSEMVVRS